MMDELAEIAAITIEYKDGRKERARTQSTFMALRCQTDGPIDGRIDIVTDYIGATEALAFELQTIREQRGCDTKENEK